jgi:FdhD protein
MLINTHQTNEYVEISEKGTIRKESPIAREAEVMLSVNGEAWLGLRCSPDDLEMMATGFLYNESFIDSIDEVSLIKVCEDKTNIDVWLNHASEKPTHWNRTSGCQGGLSRSSGSDEIPEIFPHLHNYREVQEKLSVFLAALNQMGELRTGIHTTFLFDGDKTIARADDVGRHNTLDKIAGFCVSKKIQLERPMLITTGRISSDMVLKAARMQVGLLISLHSVSSLAIDTGNKINLTLVGHARASRLNVFTYPEGITPG